MVSAPPEHALMVIAGQGQGTLTLSTTGSFLEQMRTRMVVNDFLSAKLDSRFYSDDLLDRTSENTVN